MTESGPFDRSASPRVMAWAIVFVVTSMTSMAQVTERVSVDSAGREADGFAWENALSQDGRFVVFSTTAAHVAADTNGERDVYVHDRLRRSTSWISRAMDGGPANGESRQPRISRSGRFVVFTSEASDLVGGDINGEEDVFLFDAETSSIQIVSVSTSGEQADRFSDDPDVSDDGRWVAWMSNATNLVPDDTNGYTDVFVRDVVEGRTTRVSVSSEGVEGDLFSLRPSVSASGRFVAFSSVSHNLVPDDTNGQGDIFVRDLRDNTTERVSLGAGGEEADRSSSFCRISADGRFVSFVSRATNLVDDDTNRADDVFVRDRERGETERVNLDSEGREADLGVFVTRPSISDDGRFVAFVSPATNLVPDDTNGAYDAFLRDREVGTTRRISLDASGDETEDGVFFASSANVSADGRVVAFDSESSQFVDGDTNSNSDVFVHAPVFTLQLDPPVAGLGSVVDTVTWRGQYRALGALVVTGLDGEATFFVAAFGRFDPNGEWWRSFRVPEDPEILGHSFEFQVFAQDRLRGRVDVSNAVVLRVE